MNFKQNQLKSQVEKLVDQILTSQKNLKEEFLCYSNEKTIMTLEKTNVDLKEKLEEKSIEISNINETFLSQRDFFEKKTKELLNKVAHYEIESYTFLKINANENSSFIK